MPKLIKVEDLKEGLVLAAPVVNRYGQVLLPEGAVLEAKHHMLIKTWGVKVALVHYDGESDEDVAKNEELKMQAEKKLERRMLWKPRNSIEEDLYRMAVNKLTVYLKESKE